MKAYLIRSQVGGVHTDRVFLRPPTEAELTEVLEESLMRHGHKNGKPVERFVTFVVVDTIGEPEEYEGSPPMIFDKLTDEESKAILNGTAGDPPSGHAYTGAEKIQFSGSGQVILAGDPRHPRYNG